jgi:hypothetical protein
MVSSSDLKTRAKALAATVPTPLRDLLPDVGFVRGEASAGSAGWVRTSFGTNLTSPQVIAVGEVRNATVIDRTITRVANVNLSPMSVFKSISIPTIQALPSVSFRALPRITKPDFYNNLTDKFKAVMGDWGLFNDVRNTLIWPVCKTISFGLDLAWEFMVQPSLDKVQAWGDGIRSEIETKVNLLKDRVQANFGTTIASINTEVNNTIVNIQSTVSKAVGALDGKITTQTTALENRANQTIRDLYSMWGLTPGIAATPIHVRNITETGFEWLSLGETKIHFIAIGGLSDS